MLLVKSDGYCNEEIIYKGKILIYGRNGSEVDFSFDNNYTLILSNEEVKILSELLNENIKNKEEKNNV